MPMQQHLLHATTLASVTFSAFVIATLATAASLASAAVAIAVVAIVPRAIFRCAQQIWSGGCAGNKAR